MGGLGGGKTNDVDDSICIKGESNPRRVDGNDPGYHYPINALTVMAFGRQRLFTVTLIGQWDSTPNASLL